MNYKVKMKRNTNAEKIGWLLVVSRSSLGEWTIDLTTKKRKKKRKKSQTFQVFKGKKINSESFEKNFGKFHATEIIPRIYFKTRISEQQTLQAREGGKFFFCY